MAEARVWVGYKVQTAVDVETHLIVTHEVTNIGNDRSQLAPMAKAAMEVLKVDKLDAIADRGYFNGAKLLSCHEGGIKATVPRPETSNNRKKGMFVKADFVYDGATDTYVCPAGKALAYRYTRGGRTDASAILAHGLSVMPPQGTMHIAQGTADHTLGARASDRSYLFPNGRQSEPHANPAMHGRASVRNHQGLDGRNSFPDAQTEERENGNGAARAGLQRQTDDQYDWRKSAHQSHSRLKWGLNALLAPKAAELNHRDYLRRLPAFDRRNIEPIPPAQARLRIATGCAGFHTASALG
ncbi:hypothetical protein HNQ72_004567 [Rhizobium wenxiniae]|uniref:Transposase IS4-like domain-containing protein n=1 Tax=Rhizobium wenxiniae TaxID=1737357 RepID=A0A7W9YA86_9HYPH|nr:hypothetical protein [Rhizobium wenxiniae]